MRYVWVSGPVKDGVRKYCAFCLTPIINGYARDCGTAMVYDDPKCLEEHVKLSESYLASVEQHARLT